MQENMTFGECQKEEINMKRIIAALLGVVMCLSLAACTETDTPQKETNGGMATAPTQVQEETFGLNETAVFNDLKFTATALEETSGKEYFKAEEGKVFVGLSLPLRIFPTRNKASVRCFCLTDMPMM